MRAHFSFSPALLLEKLSLIQAFAWRSGPGLHRQEVVDMRDDEIDGYLDFFESRIVSQEKVPSRRSCLFLTFGRPRSESGPGKCLHA